MLPLSTFAQKKADYELVMSKFTRYYNHEQVDSINMLDAGKGYWELENLRSMKKSMGDILSFKYLGVDTSDRNKVHVFKVKLSKDGIKAVSFTLNKTNHTETFRFTTSSDEIERMLKASK